MNEKLAMKLAWMLPKDVAYWAAIRVGAHASVGRHGATIVPELLFMDALARWRWEEPVTPGTKPSRLKRIVVSVGEAFNSIITRYMSSTGLLLTVLPLQVEKLDTVPEVHRALYKATEDGKAFRLEVDGIEDTGALKSALEKTRQEVKDAKAAGKAKLDEFAKKFEGIDPEKTRALLKKFEGGDEAELIAAGKIDEVLEKRMEKFKVGVQKDLDAASERESGALEVASTFMDRVLDNHIRAAAGAAGIHVSAVDDALLRASMVFSLDDDGNAVQYEEDGETVVLGKDAKTPYSPAEWLEDMKEKAPHWFPAGSSGGGAGGGDKNKATAKTMKRAAFDALDPIAKTTVIRDKTVIVD